ncbi:hypothetical protein PG996_005761 [Apiospora saccharicola]|uniref:Uncharacterized protein n=1 Tax=Apiospora saccharicola TaxID=335842 RepID=A0ABR1VMI1_9PEZI
MPPSRRPNLPSLQNELQEGKIPPMSNAHRGGPAVAGSSCGGVHEDAPQGALGIDASGPFDRRNDEQRLLWTCVSPSSSLSSSYPDAGDVHGNVAPPPAAAGRVAVGKDGPGKLQLGLTDRTRMRNAGNQPTVHAYTIVVLRLYARSNDQQTVGAGMYID